MDLFSTPTRSTRSISTLVGALLVIWCLCGCSDNSTEQRDSSTPQQTISGEALPTPKNLGNIAEVTSTEPVSMAIPPLAREHTIPQELQQHVKLMPENSQTPIELELPHHHIESFQSRGQDLFQSPTTLKRKQHKEADKKIRIGGGILTDPEAQDLTESLDGIEIKLDLKWD